jgi:hypothetical protein
MQLTLQQTAAAGDASLIRSIRFFKTLNRANSINRRVCRGRANPKTSHTALGAV